MWIFAYICTNISNLSDRYIFIEQQQKFENDFLKKFIHQFDTSCVYLIYISVTCFQFLSSWWINAHQLYRIIYNSIKLITEKIIIVTKIQSVNVIMTDWYVIKMCKQIIERVVKYITVFKIDCIQSLRSSLMEVVYYWTTSLPTTISRAVF